MVTLLVIHLMMQNILIILKLRPLMIMKIIKMENCQGQKSLYLALFPLHITHELGNLLTGFKKTG